MSKVVEITGDNIIFDDGFVISHWHPQDCCESHYLDYGDLDLKELQDAGEFDLTNDSFFEVVRDYGIRLISKSGYKIAIPGYADNNGYYSSDLILEVRNPKTGYKKDYDITDGQKEME